MASALYDSYKEGMLGTGPVNLSSDTIRAIFVETGYTFSAAHDFFDDLTNTQGDGGTGRANGEALGTKSITNGVFDAADTVFASVTGTNINAIVLYKDTGVDGTSNLIAYIDGFSQISPSADQVTIQWDSGANKIFAL
jgi:hypothetical protein